jgi:hypothetical protein
VRASLTGLALALPVLLLGAPAALADELGAEVAEGRALAESVQAGQRSCGELSDDQLELLGEYTMDRYLGNRAAHEAMNRRMVQMMGAAGERRMHIALGERFARCATGSTSRWVAPMLGMMGRYGGGSPRGVGPGMTYGRGYGSMMGRGYGPAGAGADGDGDVSAIGIAAIGFGAALLGGLLVALGMRLRRRPTGAR